MRTELLRELARVELVRLLEIPSPHGEEEAILAYLEERVGRLGHTPTRIPANGAGWNLMVAAGDRPSLLYVAHVDTVRPTWAWEPRARIDGNRVSGLGAQDDKAGVAALIVTLELLGRSGGLPEHVGLVFTIDEESGGRGSEAVARELRPRHVVVLEGTGGAVCRAEAGYVEAWVHFEGRSVHGAFIEEGENAILKAARFVTALPTLDAFTVVPHPLLGPSLPSVEEITGGGPLFAVPGEAAARVDVRIAPPTTAQEVQGQLEEFAAAYGGRVEVIGTAEPFEVSPHSPIVTALRDTIAELEGAQPEIAGMQSWTDAHNFVEIAGAEAVVYGPGHLRRAHRPDEWVDLSEVTRVAQVLSELARRTPSLDRPSEVSRKEK